MFSRFSGKISLSLDREIAEESRKCRKIPISDKYVDDNMVDKMDF